MGSMTGTVHVKLAHTLDYADIPTGGYVHTSGSAPATLSETEPTQVDLEICFSAEAWTEENDTYNLWAFLDLNSDSIPNVGEPAGRVAIDVSCRATTSPCHTIVLDCVDGYSCVVPPITSCNCDPAMSCDEYSTNPSRVMVCCLP